jgi:N-acetyl-anhydromuramyl-L-alanine amidase AmpD
MTGCWHPTPNFTKGRTQAVHWIIVHSTRGGSNDDYTATINWFANPVSQVSSHVLIARDGREARFVADEDTAWHAGFHNPYTLGLEFEQATADTPFTDGQLAKGAEQCHNWLEKFGDIAIVGHENTPQGIQGGKSDPGYLFDWSHFMEMIMADTEARQSIAILKQQESLKAAVGDNDMGVLIARLQYFGVLPVVTVKKPKLDGT